MKNFILEVKLSVPNSWIIENRFDAVDYQHGIRTAIEEHIANAFDPNKLDEIKISVRRVIPKKKSKIKVKKIRLYTFDQLSDEGKEKALFEQGFCNVDHDWWESTYEDAKRVGLTLTGFDIDRANYCHGYFKHGAIETADKIIEEHGKDCDTFKTATAFLADRDKLVKKYSNGTDRVTEENENEFDKDCDALEKDFLHDILEDYRIILQKEHDYLTSEAAIIETIKANNWTFTAEGKLEN